MILHGYKFGFELLIVNGFITFAGLFFLSLNNKSNTKDGNNVKYSVQSS